LPESLAAVAYAGGRFRMVGVYGDFLPDHPFDGSARYPRMICVFTRDPGPRGRKGRDHRGSQYGLQLS
jgi:hypothetical protein